MTLQTYNKMWLTTKYLFIAEGLPLICHMRSPARALNEDLVLLFILISLLTTEMSYVLILTVDLTQHVLPLAVEIPEL